MVQQGVNPKLLPPDALSLDMLFKSGPSPSIHSNQVGGC